MKKFKVAIKLSEIKIYEVEAENKEMAEFECMDNESLVPIMEYPEVPEIHSCKEIE